MARCGTALKVNNRSCSFRKRRIVWDALYTTASRIIRSSEISSDTPVQIASGVADITTRMFSCRASSISTGRPQRAHETGPTFRHHKDTDRRACLHYFGIARHPSAMNSCPCAPWLTRTCSHISSYSCPDLRQPGAEQACDTRMPRSLPYS